MFITWGRGGVDFEPKKGGVRTAIDLFPVHVSPKRGAETPRSRLRGVGGGVGGKLGVEGETWYTRIVKVCLDSFQITLFVAQELEA